MVAADATLAAATVPSGNRGLQARRKKQEGEDGREHERRGTAPAADGRANRDVRGVDRHRMAEA